MTEKYYALWHSSIEGRRKCIDAQSDRGNPSIRRELIDAGYDKVTEQETIKIRDEMGLASVIL